MYIWIGCKLPEAFEQEIRSLCLELNKSLQLDTTAFSLPQHISLKISFEAPQHETVLDALAAFLSAQPPFTVRIKNPSQNGNILWLSTEENDTLSQIHSRLDMLLEGHFDIPQHEFDKTFLFHSTLFIDNNTEKLAKMREALGKYAIARALNVNTFLLGLSETGKPGSYHVVRQIKV